ncbi:adhesion G protein-coupled receptor B2 [Trichonephila clavipes]|nr:adhesion G protein-coupled receptor B2 [Trichonephila clavipes]
MVAERLARHHTPVTMVDELWHRVEAIWASKPVRAIRSLFDSMPRYDFWHMTATAGSDVVQSGRPIFDNFFQHLWPYIGNNTANVVFQMVKRLWLIRIDQ